MHDSLVLVEYPFPQTLLSATLYAFILCTVLQPYPDFQLIILLLPEH